MDPIMSKTNLFSTVLMFCTLFGGMMIPYQATGQIQTSIQIQADNPLFPVQPTMWGLFFEDINFAADGGIYAELVKNRSFEFPDPMEGWEVEGSSFFRSPLRIVNRSQENPDNPRFARIQVKGSTCLVNKGFRGMGIKESEQYRFCINASVPEGEVRIKAKIIGEGGQEIGELLIESEGRSWKIYESLLTASETDPRASLKICFEGDGSIDADMISLFPVDTWKNRPKGMRRDLVQKLADLNPGFFRFPGGCIVEGRDLEKRYQWKNTVGDIENRGLLINRWNDENSRATPDYFQTFGLGFYEYFLLAEDLDAEAVPILNCGMACQFNTGEVVEMNQMAPYVQDALDLIEFANGPADSEWGSKRAEMGHPEPFHMKYLGIGNEQWGAAYFERYALFEKELSAKHPEIQIISSTGPMASGPLFDYNTAELNRFDPALVDEHYYNSPDWFFQNATRYDEYDRDSYKIFAGEYAAANVRMASPENRNVWETALSEAAFMTGLERNADMVYMASYAPLLAHTEAWQWTPDLIWFDNLDSYITPNYYVQKLFSTNSGTHILNILKDGRPLTGEEGLYASAVLDQIKKEIVVKIVSNNDLPKTVEFVLKSEKRLSVHATKTVLQCDDLTAKNSLSDPEHIEPVTGEIQVNGKELSCTLDPYSLTIIQIKQE